MSEKKKRGFATMTPEKLREIASKGGKKVQALGKGHRFSSEEAKIAGSKGGLAVVASGKRHCLTSEEAKQAGAKGGKASGEAKRRKKAEMKDEEE